MKNQKSKFIITFIVILLGANFTTILSNLFYRLQFAPISIQIQIDTNNILKSNCECRKNEQISLELNKNHDHLIIYSFDTITKTIKNLFNISVEEFENSKFSCDLYALLRRGKSQKVISYSLYGKDQFYYKKLKDVVKQMKRLYPDWSMRIFHDNSINEKTKCEIECLRNDESHGSETYYDNIDFCNIETDLKQNPTILKSNQQNDQTSLSISFTQFNLSYVHAMMWRFLPIGDSFVDVFSSRDTDSFLLQREVDSVNVWLNSNNKGHIMRGKSIAYFFQILVCILI